MDQTIRRILELDAETEERLEASRTECRKLVSDARARAAAMAEAERHRTRDTIEEFEEQTQSDAEARMAELRTQFDSRADLMTQQFSAQYDALLEALFAETLREAER